MQRAQNAINKEVQRRLAEERKIAQAEITETQQKDLIEILQNREEVHIREMIDNSLVAASQILNEIATDELSDNQRKDLIGAVQQREEEIIRGYVDSQYMDTRELLSMVAARGP